MSLGPINLSPILSGYVADRYTWRTNFWILTAFTAMNLILIILFASETRYKRPFVYNTDTMAPENMHGSLAVESNEANQECWDRIGKEGTAMMANPEQERPLTYWQELKPFSGLHVDKNIWTPIVRLFSCVMYPAVTWTFLVAGTYSGWVHLS